MRRILAASFVVLLLFSSAVLPALAGWSWCSTDPNILLPDGSVAHVILSVPEDQRDAPLILEVRAPSGSRVVGGSGNLDVTTTVRTGPDGEIRVQLYGATDARWSVRLDGVNLGNAEGLRARWVLP